MFLIVGNAPQGSNANICITFRVTYDNIDLPLKLCLPAHENCRKSPGVFCSTIRLPAIVFVVSGLAEAFLVSFCKQRNALSHNVVEAQPRRLQASARRLKLRPNLYLRISVVLNVFVVYGYLCA